MKLFNLDCHISVIADIKQIFENLGHEVTSWSVSGHNWVFGRNPNQVEVVNQNTWMNLDENMCDRFYQRYKDELSKYDAFICTYPPSFCMLYERFNKPIILQIPIRYEVPFHNNKFKWNYFNEYLRRNIDSGKIIPVANSDYDKQYFEFFVGRDCQLIPNICDYTNTKWNPSKDKFLYYSRLPLNLKSDRIVDKSSLGKYEWEDLSSYLGIIMIPYNCSTMSIFENYSSNIPLLCPSKSFMRELYSNYGNFVLSELTWNKTFRLPPGSVIDCNKEKDPNRYDNIDIMSQWIELSDFYNNEWQPYITYFDSFEDLAEKMKTVNLSETSLRMSEFNKIRKEKIYSSWEKILSNISNA